MTPRSVVIEGDEAYQLTGSGVKLSEPTDATQGVFLSGGADLYVGAIGLNDPGTTAADSGATLVGAFDDNGGADFVNVQEAIDYLGGGGGLGAIFRRIDGSNAPFGVTDIETTGAPDSLIVTNNGSGVGAGAATFESGTLSGAVVKIIGSGTNSVGLLVNSPVGIQSNATVTRGIFARSSVSNSGLFQSSDSANTATTLIVREEGTQTANMIEVQDSASVAVFSVDQDGVTKTIYTTWKDISVLTGGFTPNWANYGPEGLEWAGGDTKANFHVWINVPNQPGTIISQARVKFGPVDSTDGVTLTLLKRLDSTAAATAWTTVETATYTGTGGDQVQTLDIDPDETMAANTSYAIRVDLAASGATMADSGFIYSVGYETTTRVY